MTEANRNELIQQLKKEARNDPDLTTMDDQQLQKLIAHILDRKLEWAKDHRPEAYRELAALNFRERRQITSAVFEAIRGLGVLGQIIDDPSITEVMINGHRDIFVERGGGLTRHSQHFENEEELKTIISKFVSDAGRAVSESDPIVDTRLSDGSRVNVVMPPIALNGPIVTIRRFSKEPMTVEKLVSNGSITPSVAEVLRLLVKARYNIFISGGTGSGKTTFLNALSSFIPSDERIITIEDSAELQIQNVENLVRLETRNAGPDGSGAIPIQALIKSALRMRPDRIIVGEVRGAEALDMLQAMNTGHDGSISTGHANSTIDMLSRLETMVLQGSEGMPLEAIRQQIGSALDIIIHLSRMRDKSRKTMEIVEILGYDPTTRTYRINPLYQFVEKGEDMKGKIKGQLERTGNPMKKTLKLKNAGIQKVI